MAGNSTVIRSSTRKVVLDTAFMEELNKLSVDAELAMIDTGRPRLTRAIQDAIALYLEQTPPGGVGEL